MLNTIKQRKQEGFTIIEVMIVLAIAAMILLVVLLAVPALQRNSRNTTLKNDVSAIAAGISEFAANNDGALPSPSGGAGGSTCSAGSVTLSKTGATSSTPKIQGSTAASCIASAASQTPAAGSIIVDLGYTCPDTVTGTSVTPVVSARATALIYANETAGGALQAKCLAS